jgi:citrate lyase subunit beta / citryl-CoA lyase
VKMNKSTAITGNSGPKIRSDCEIELEITSGGGLVIDLTSKVKALYGESIIKLTYDVMGFFGVTNAHVRITDSGALPFVIAARLEAVIKKLKDTNLEYLQELIPENCYSTERDRFRFSRLYVPGNSPGLMINAGLHSAEGIILDLEDSVAPEKKDESRYLVRNALRQVNFYGAERMVRINQGARGIGDLSFVIPHNVNLVIIPKCENAEYVRSVSSEIESIQNRCNLSNSVFLMPVIESALGVENACEIARSCPNVVAIAIGLEDYTADLGVARSTEGLESLYARTRIIVAAKAAGIQPVDSVFSDVGDMEALHHNVKTSKALGFEGMGCIHPRQIQVIRKGFFPEAAEIEKSMKIVNAYETARKKGLGVVALGTRMIDPPIVARAMKTIGLAVRLGLLRSDWMSEAFFSGNNEV